MHGIFKEEQVLILTSRCMGLSGAQDLSCLRIRCKILEQASILLSIDIDLLQQLNNMYDWQNIAESAYMTLHVIMCQTCDLNKAVKWD